MLLKSINVDQKLLETVFSIVICRQSGYLWQSKTLFLNILGLRSLIVLTFSVAIYRVCDRPTQSFSSINPKSSSVEVNKFILKSILMMAAIRTQEEAFQKSLPTSALN